MSVEILSPRKAVHQARRYWIADGLAEIVVGAGFVGMALILWLDAYPAWPHTAWWRLARTAYIIAFVLGARRVVQHLKWRLTYPRTGYLAYPRGAFDRRLLVALLAAAALALALLAGWRWFPGVAYPYLLIQTGGMALLYLGMAGLQRWGRGVGYALLTLLIGGAALGWWPASGVCRPAWGAGCLFAALGAAQMLGGGWALRQYLRRFPHPLGEETP